MNVWKTRSFIKSNTNFMLLSSATSRISHDHENSKNKMFSILNIFNMRYYWFYCYRYIHFLISYVTLCFKTNNQKFPILFIVTILSLLNFYYGNNIWLCAEKSLKVFIHVSKYQIVAITISTSKLFVREIFCCKNEE